MFSAVYLIGQVPLLPAIAILHLHVLYPWVHIHLGHAGIKAAHSLVSPFIPKQNHAYTQSSKFHKCLIAFNYLIL